MDKVKRVLSNYGLSDKEIQVYLVCLDKQELTPFRLAKFTKIPRTTIYSILSELALKGLVEISQSDGMAKRQTQIVAKNPSILRKYINDKRKALQSLEVDVTEILPILKGNFLQDKSNTDFKFISGVEGAIGAFRDDFDEIDMPLYAFDYLQPMDAIGRNRMNEIVNKDARARSLFKTKEYTLLPLNDWTKHVLSYQTERNPTYLHNAEWRYVDSPIFNTSVRISIKGDRVRVSCVEGDEIYGILITSKALSSSLISMHQAMWQEAKEITKEMIKSWGPNEFLQEENKRKHK